MVHTKKQAGGDPKAAPKSSVLADPKARIRRLVVQNRASGRITGSGDAVPSAAAARDRIIWRAYYLEARAGFPSDRALADAMGVHRSQVSRWSQGKLAQRENAWLLRDLAATVSRLADHYEASTIQKWLFAANPEIEDEQPIDALKQGRLPEVLMAIEAQTSGAFA